MAFKRVNEERFNLPLVPDEMARVKYHAKRLGWSQTAIIQAAVNEKMNSLDEQELNEKHAKAARRKGATAMGNLPTVNGVERDNAPRSPFALPSLPPGLHEMIYPSDVDEKLPDRFMNALETWTREAKKATNAVDLESCIDRMRIDLRGRDATETQVDKVVSLLHERLARDEQIGAKKIVKLPDEVPITNADAD